MLQVGGVMSTAQTSHIPQQKLDITLARPEKDIESRLIYDTPRINPPVQPQSACHIRILPLGPNPEVYLLLAKGRKGEVQPFRRSGRAPISKRDRKHLRLRLAEESTSFYSQPYRTRKTIGD